MRTTTETSKSPLDLQTQRPAAFRFLQVMLLLAMPACGANVDPGSDSTTHFWITCGTDAECDGDDSCICGRCTRHCSADAQCGARNNECVATAAALACDMDEFVCAPTSLRADMVVEVDASIPTESDEDSGVQTSPATDQSASSASEPAPTDAEGAAPVPQAADDEAASDEAAAEPNDDSVPLPPNDDSAQPAAPVTTSEQGSPSELPISPMIPSPLSAYASMSTAWSTWTGSPSVPSDCVQASALNGDQLCDIEWKCGDDDYLVSCASNEPGDWECMGYWDIDLDQLRRNYVTLSLQASNGESACLTASSALMTPGADQQCVANYRSPETVDEGYTCQWEEACSTQVNSATLTMAGARSGRCLAAGDSYVCQCDGLGLNRSYIIAAPPGNGPCALARATCETDETPTTWTETDCTSDSSPLTGTESCRLERTCPITAPLSEQVLTFSQVRDEVSCEDDGNVRSCRCEGDVGSIDWSEAPQVGAESCASDLEVCERAGDITFPAVPECSQFSNNETDSTCSSKWQCTTTGMLDGRELDFTQVAEVECEGDSENGTWLCTCATDYAEVVNVVEDSLSGSNACDLEFQKCQTALSFVSARPRPTAR